MSSLCKLSREERRPDSRVALEELLSSKQLGPFSSFGQANGGDSLSHAWTIRWATRQGPLEFLLLTCLRLGALSCRAHATQTQRAKLNRDILSPPISRRRIHALAASYWTDIGVG
jgi:hypothetical protein